ncbi:MAG TPA: transketolase [Clostridiales bacterium]|nr:transketolase [Clostridiales bacterium]
MANTIPIPCREAFSDTLLECAEKDRNIIAVTTDSRGSVMLGSFAQECPGQFVEMGIAEQNAIGIAAGLAACGKKPFVCGPACFLSARSLEQMKVDVIYSNINVKVIGVSGGISYGPLGATHHSLHDIAVLRSIPGVTILLPCDVHQTRKMTEILAKTEGPVYVRMGRVPVPDVYSGDNIPFQIGKANLLMEGNDISIIAAGEMVRVALDAGLLLKGKGIHARVIDMHTLKPLDVETIREAAAETQAIITVEEHNIHGGLGAAVAEVVVQSHPVPMKILGIPDEPTVSGEPSEVFQYYGLTGEGICQTVQNFLNGVEMTTCRK